MRWKTRAPSHPRLPHPSVFEGWALRTPALVTAAIGKHPATSPEFSHPWQVAYSVLGFRIKTSGSASFDRVRMFAMRCGPVQAALEFDRARRLREFDRAARMIALERNRRPNGGQPMPLDHRVQWKRLAQFCAIRFSAVAGSAARARASAVIARRGSEPASVPQEQPSEPARGSPTPLASCCQCLVRRGSLLAVMVLGRLHRAKSARLRSLHFRTVLPCPPALPATRFPGLALPKAAETAAPSGTFRSTDKPTDSGPKSSSWLSSLSSASLNRASSSQSRDVRRFRPYRYGLPGSISSQIPASIFPVLSVLRASTPLKMAT